MALISLGVHHEDFLKALSINADASNGEEVLTDHEASGIDSSDDSSHVRHHNSLVLSRKQTQLPEVVLEVSDSARLASFAFLLPAEDVDGL